MFGWVAGGWDALGAERRPVVRMSQIDSVAASVTELFALIVVENSY